MSSSLARSDARNNSLMPQPPAAGRLRRPSWRDRRLAVGVVLLLASTVLGARLLGTGDRGVLVWSVRQDLAAGTALRPSDLQARTVDLGGAAALYLGAGSALPGDAVLTRPVGAGELLAVDALGVDPSAAARRTVALPVERFHAPADLARGERVDVYVSAAGGTGSTPAPARRLVAGVRVVDVEQDDGGFGGGAGGRGVLVELADDQVAALVGGRGDGTLDLVRLPAVAP